MPPSSRILHGFGFFVSVDQFEPERAYQIALEIQDMGGRTFNNPRKQRVTHIIMDVPFTEEPGEQEPAGLPEAAYGPDENGWWSVMDLFGCFARPESHKVVLPLAWLRACQEQQRFVGTGVNEPEYGGYRLFVWIDPDARLSDWEDPPDEYTAYAHDSSSSDGISTDESMSWAYS